MTGFSDLLSALPVYTALALSEVAVEIVIPAGALREDGIVAAIGDHYRCDNLEEMKNAE